ncbi:MAG: hypothetical protein H6818_22330 [Phycisphaerales bacterium]|nr:hypothetical protein [Phycisphaerales bacterium]
MNDTLRHPRIPRKTKLASRKGTDSARRDFIDILRDEIAKGEYLTAERISRTVDVLAPIVAQEMTAKGAA